MRRNHTIKLKVSGQEKAFLTGQAKRMGFQHLSAYLLWCGNSGIMEELQEIKLLLRKNG